MFALYRRFMWSWRRIGWNFFWVNFSLILRIGSRRLKGELNLIHLLKSINFLGIHLGFIEIKVTLLRILLYNVDMAFALMFRKNSKLLFISIVAIEKKWNFKEIFIEMWIIRQELFRLKDASCARTLVQKALLSIIWILVLDTAHFCNYAKA